MLHRVYCCTRQFSSFSFVFGPVGYFVVFLVFSSSSSSSSSGWQFTKDGNCHQTTHAHVVVVVVVVIAGVVRVSFGPRRSISSTSKVVMYQRDSILVNVDEENQLWTFQRTFQSLSLPRSFEPNENGHCRMADLTRCPMTNKKATGSFDVSFFSCISWCYDGPFIGLTIEQLSYSSRHSLIQWNA